MTPATALLERLKASGLTVKVVGSDEIEIEGPPPALDAMPVDEIRRQKAEIIKTLGAPCEQEPKPPPLTLDQVAERIGFWLKVTDNPPRNASKIWKDLADATEAFALGCWAYAAVMAGWSDGGLYALDEGLIPQQLHRGLHLIKIESDAASVMNGKGNIEYLRRPRTTSPPWWNNQRTAAYQNTPARAARKGT
jgi:hypothetical protein